jgi:hypothetical protein
VISSGEGVREEEGSGEFVFFRSMRSLACWLSRLRSTLVTCVLMGGVLLSVPAPALAAIPEVVEESVLNVKGTSATLRAEINPNGDPTRYRFEYATNEAALLAGDGEVLPAPPSPEGEVGAGAEGAVVEAHPQDLQPQTSYWYRILASAEGKESGCQAPGTCPSFTTRPAGSELILPDNRAWELVSPPPGENGATAAVEPISTGGPLIQAGEDGGAFAYGVIGSVEAEPAGATNYSQVLSVRDSGGGWSSRDTATPHEQATGVSVGQGQEYKYFSSDLSVGLVEPLALPSLPAEAAPLSPAASELTVYLRADEPLVPGALEQGAYDEAVAEGGYLPLVTSCPSESEKCGPSIEGLAKREEVPAGRKFGGSIIFDGATDDLSHVILDSCVPLTAKTPEGNATEGCGLYEWSGGRLQLVSLLPDHEQASSGNATLGYDNADAQGAISRDGSRIVWSNRAGGTTHLYMRDLPGEQTIQLDENRGGSGGEASPEFQFASDDSTKVFFTDTEDLTANATAEEGEPDLYECEIVDAAGKLSCTLRDLTVDSGRHANVQGVVLAGSNDSSHIYFVAEGKLTSKSNEQGKEAEAGADNLYMLRYSEEKGEWEAPVFIAVVSGEDERDWEGESGGGELETVTSRVSPDGEYLAFMSEQDLTGYDSSDAYSGAKDEEVFLYDSSDNRLVCASCDPTGERPVGVYDSFTANSGTGLLMDRQGIWHSGRWLAANVPGWTAYRLGDARYQSRYLSDEGRLFFNSPDALVPQATNGLADVYQYEPMGVGGCDASNATFSERSEGCVGLISSGSSGEESAFLDASASGEDVFFLSSAQLVPEDKGSALAVYDAHVCSVASTCPTEAVSPPSCVTEASCKAAPSPQPSVFGASGSATFTGTGNLVPSPATRTTTKKIVGCPKHKRLSHGKCVKSKGKRKAKARKAGNDGKVGR